MFLNTSFPYIKSFRSHFLVGAILGFFIVFLVIFLQPMGANNYSNPYKNLYFSGYGGIVFLSYLFFAAISTIYVHFFKVWKWLEEILLSFLFISTVIIITFMYTEILINKSAERLNLDGFLWWYKNMFLGFGIITSILMILLRRYYGKTIFIKEEKSPQDVTRSEGPLKVITITGDLKKEFFRGILSNILFIKSEGNYVFIYFTTSQGTQEKMLRSTLKNIHNQLPAFLKAHRSFIINPLHIKDLKGNAQNGKLYLKEIEEPISVSKTYFENIKRVFSSQQQGNH